MAQVRNDQSFECPRDAQAARFCDGYPFGEKACVTKKAAISSVYNDIQETKSSLASHNIAGHVLITTESFHPIDVGQHEHKGCGSMRDENLRTSTLPKLGDPKANNCLSTKLLHPATSSNNLDAGLNDCLKEVCKQCTPFNEGMPSEMCIMANRPNRPILKFLNSLKPNANSEFKRSLSTRFSLRGEASLIRPKDLAFRSTAGQHCHADSSGNVLRHSWCAGKHKMWSLRKWSDDLPYRSFNPSSASLLGQASQCSCDHRAKNQTRLTTCTTDVERLMQPAGTKFVVKVDIHRSESGEQIVIGQGRQFTRRKKKTQRCFDDIFHIQESFKPKRSRPPAVFDSNYQSRVLTDEPFGLNGTICRQWLKGIDAVTRPCPGCSKYVGPTLITLSLFIILVCLVIVIVFFAWIAGKLGL